MKKMMATWIFLVLVLTSALFTIGLTTIKQNEKYKTIESDLVEAAQGYLEINDIKLSTGKKLEITLSDLESENILPNMSVDGDECDGSVTAVKGVSEITYKAVIKCKNYETIE